MANSFVFLKVHGKYQILSSWADTRSLLPANLQRRYIYATAKWIGSGILGLEKAFLVEEGHLLQTAPFVDVTSSEKTRIIFYNIIFRFSLYL